MIFIDKSPSQDFKILNLADLHIKKGDLDGSSPNSKIIVGTIRGLIERTRPSLITLSGDQSACGDTEASAYLASLLDEYGIPYACAWGNHDQDKGLEGLDCVIAEYQKHPLFTYENGRRELGRGNYVICIREGDTIALAIIVMDTHNRSSYVENGEERLGWGTLTPEQHAWYIEQITALKDMGARDAMLLTHIPLYAYISAWNEAFIGGDPKITIKHEDDKECWREGYKDSFGIRLGDISSHPQDDHFFEIIKEHGLTSHCLCGHDHLNTFSIKYQGVRLSYALKCGPGSFWDERLSGGTLITVNENGIHGILHEHI